MTSSSGLGFGRRTLSCAFLRPPALGLGLSYSFTAGEVLRSGRTCVRAAPASRRRGAVVMMGKKKRAVVEEDGGVDVFGGAGMSQEELLAAALGDDKAIDDGPAGQEPVVKKKKGKKASQPVDEVDVFGGVGMTQEQLLADALGHDETNGSPPDTSSVAASKKKKKKKVKKGKKGTVVDDDENAVDVFAAQDVNKDGENESGQSSETLAVSPTVDQATDLEQGRVKSEPEAEVEAKAEPDEQDEEEEVDDEFKSEMESFVAEIDDFTEVGRRKKSLSKAAAQKQASYGSGGEKYTSIRMEDVGMNFRGEDILRSVTWEVKTKDRIGLVGQNGCGKTTLLKIIAGNLQQSSGEVTRSSKKTRASFLRQEFIDELVLSNTLREEFRSSFKVENELVMKYEAVENAVSSAGDNLEQLESLLNELEDLRQQCENANAWNLDSRIDRLMPGLGFESSDNESLVSSFSGGWKVRIGIGKVMLSDPDILLLDEPTNHLDLESVEWIEKYLSKCELPMVIVSHDREFMDVLCTKVVEIENGEAFEYVGNYSKFITSKAERRKAWTAAFERQKKFLDEQRQFIRRFRTSGARAAQVKSRERMLERMERTGELVRRPPTPRKPLVFRFPEAPRSARDVVILEDINHKYGPKRLFTDASIALERGDKIAILGPNGSGKSTLLRFIMQTENPDSGDVQSLENENVIASYFEQNQADVLDLEKTVMETAKNAAPSGMAYEEIRALLGKFLFKGDSVNKNVGALSGGEKARLALCKMMMIPSNLVVLDEPTNHLDIEAKEMLEEALQHFDGTLLVVSHDRYFVSQVAQQIVAVEDEELVLYDGDYKHYMERNEDMRNKMESRFIEGVTNITSAPKVDFEPAVEVRKAKKKKNFGGGGIASGKTKEMNAKRWAK